MFPFIILHIHLLELSLKDANLMPMGMPEMENHMESQTDKDVFFGALAVWYPRCLPWVPRCAKPLMDCQNKWGPQALETCTP